MVVVDLGAAPGGWSQLAIDLVGERGRVVASDILAMKPIAGVEFIDGDFTERAVLERILRLLGDRGADLVISDMAPNISGIRAADQMRAMHLAELALELASQTLTEGRSLLVKVFQG